MIIREAKDDDFESIWPIFKEIVSAGETYAIDRNISKEEAYNFWFLKTDKVYVVVENDKILATYYIKKNQSGPGKHICNCGYMVSSHARGQGLAGKMCQHSQDIARSLQFTAMQFNAVVSTNKIAIKLWEKLGFKIIGTIPNAFLHPKFSYVDSYIMYKSLI